MLILRSTGGKFSYGRSDGPSAACTLVSFFPFLFYFPFSFLLSRVPHFISFPPPDLERRRQIGSGSADGARRRERPAGPPTPNPFLSSPIHFFLLHSLSSLARFSWRRQEQVGPRPSFAA
jgi:hypothetical protein